MRRAARSIGLGYSETGRLLRQAGRRPFGEASSTFRIWLFPQFVVVLGVMPIVGAVQGYWMWLPAVAASLVLVALGLALTAAVGRSAARDPRSRWRAMRQKADEAAAVVVGMTTAKAKAYCEAQGLEFRVRTEDAEEHVLTADLRLDRLTVTVVAGVLTAAVVA